MTRTVLACADCGEEVPGGTTECPVCAGPIERVDSLLVALADALDAALRPPGPGS